MTYEEPLMTSDKERGCWAGHVPREKRNCRNCHHYFDLTQCPLAKEMFPHIFTQEGKALGNYINQHK